MTSTLNDVGQVTARLVDISRRLARFEPVDPAEIEAFQTDVEALTAGKEKAE